jgi:hypothetical protein
MVDANDQVPGTAKWIPMIADRQRIHELCELLKPMQVLTDTFQRQGTTANIILKLIWLCYSKLRKINHAYWFSFQTELLHNMSTRLQDCICNKSFILASVLDPRTKFYLYSDENREKMSLFWEAPHLDTVLSVLKDEMQLHTHIAQPVTEIPPKKRKTEEHYYDEEDDLIDSEVTSHSLSGDLQLELDLYIREPRQSNEKDVLQYWKTNETKLPTLSKIAKQYLSIPVTSGDVERLFSVAGAIQRSRRASLHTSTVENLLLYKEYLK